MGGDRNVQRHNISGELKYFYKFFVSKDRNLLCAKTIRP